MNKINVVRTLARANAFVTAAVIASAALLPALLLNSSASGAQLNNRFIDMSATQTSEGSGRDGGDAFGQDVTYGVSFSLASAHANLEGVVVDFCSNSPIVGDACTAPTGFDVNEGTLAIANLVGGASLTLDAATDTNTVVLTNGTGDNLAGAATVSFSLGTAAASDGITNPTTLGTFYARILTYTDSTVAAAYAPNGGEGAYIDDGGIALSVTNELTITARVQEVLQFCIGTETDSTITPAVGDDCTDVSGTALDLGVVEASTTQRTSDADILNDGLAMIRTNASAGAVIYYKAEQETGLSNGGAGTLRRAGSDDCGTIASVANSCFNSAGGDITNPAQTAIASGTELFGMTLTNLSTATGGATAALSCNAAYDGDGSCGAGAATGYAWDPTGAFDTIAATSGPADDEHVQIEFAATASPTTPTGLYTATANFVATATF